jgi:hypothetical protein
MTHTVQPRSFAISDEKNKNLTRGKYETEEDVGYLLSIFDSLKNLSRALERMDNVQNNLCNKLTNLERIVHNI